MMPVRSNALARFGGRSWAALVAIAALTGCVSVKRSPPARFYVLSAISNPADATSGDGVGALVAVLRVSVPSWLDRPQLVSRTGDNSVHVDELARWAEPLPAGLTRTLAEDLARQLPGHRVRVDPRDAQPQLTLRVELVDFSRADGHARLEARWEVAGGDPEATVHKGRTDTTVPVASSGPEATVAALSEALGVLSSELAEAVRSLP
jgi:uncharacterized lipoprotein YmbA